MASKHVEAAETREFLRGLSDWLETNEGRKEFSKWSSAVKDEVTLTKILMHQLAKKSAFKPN